MLHADLDTALFPLQERGGGGGVYFIVPAWSNNDYMTWYPANFASNERPLIGHEKSVGIWELSSFTGLKIYGYIVTRSEDSVTIRGLLYPWLTADTFGLFYEYMKGIR